MSGIVILDIDCMLSQRLLF